MEMTENMVVIQFPDPSRKLRQVLALELAQALGIDDVSSRLANLPLPVLTASALATRVTDKVLCDIDHREGKRFPSPREGVDLHQAFAAIPDAVVRGAIVAFIASVAKLYGQHT